MFDEQGRAVYRGQEALQKFAEALGSRLREARSLHYKTTFQNLPISIENRKGSIRRGVDGDGDEWETRMKHPYGYIRGTEGSDGDHVDVFVGPNEDAAYAYVVHSNNPETGEHDEDKVMLGFNSSKRAKEVFLQHYDGPKFFGGIDAIPMWKFSEKVFLKKHTTKKLVASMRESSRSIPVGIGATGLDQSMKRAMLGNHQPQMINPEVRESAEEEFASLQLPEDMLEGGPGSGPHMRGRGGPKGDVSFKSDEELQRTLRDFGKQNLAARSDLKKEFEDFLSKKPKKEAREHGVRGMKWGHRKSRPNSQKSRPQSAEKPKPLSPPKAQANLANDPRTLSMMSTGPSLRTLNDLHSKQTADAQKANQQRQSPKSNEQHHSEALQELKGLGWKVLRAFAGAAGVGGAADTIASVVRSPGGERMKLHTHRDTGEHSLSRGRRKESRAFESRLGSFLQESRRSPGTYYAREMGRYGTDAEESDIDLIRESFEGRVDFPRTKRHAQLGMGYFHEKIDRAKRVVVKPTRGKKLTTGVFSEVKHAIKKGIPVYAIYKGKLRRVKNVEALGKPNKSGHFGKIIFRKKSKR